MRQTKPVSLLSGLRSVFLAAFMAIPNLVWADASTQLTIVPTPAPAAPPGTPLAFKLEVRSTTNGVVCLVQTGTSLTSTNPADWHTLLSVQPSPTNTVTIPGFQATNHTAFFRLAEFLAQTDTNAPAWSNSVGGRFTFQQVSNLWAQWNAASDNFGVASYRIYLGTNLFTNVLGNILSCILPVTLGQRADIRIQAVDASDNATDILSFAYLPGDKLVAVGDENGRAYLMQIQADGTFSAPRQIANFGSPDWGAGFGDFDRDGILDLITGHGGNNTMTPFFFKGRADGTSESPVPLPTAPGANNYMMGAAVADFDCDGRLDFVVNGNDRYIYFYWGNGDGTFTLERRDWGTYGQSGRAMSAGDFNEDGRDDFVRATYSNGQVRLYLSNGDRTFTDTNLVGIVGDAPYTVVAGDFDEDGHLDLIVNAGGNGDVTFFKGHGDGTFTNLGVNGDRANLDLNNYAAMSTADYNGDSHLDLVLVNYSGHSAYFFAGNGDGTFSTNRVTLATGLGNTLGVASPPLPPRVDVAISPTDPTTNLNQALPFQATGSGTTTSDLFRWTFGDTSTNPVAWTFGTNVVNMGQTVSHVWSNEARFLVRLWHTDALGRQSVRGTWATIKGVPPVADPGGPYSFGETMATQAVWYATLDGSASTDDFGIVSYLWSFGDGTFATNNGPKVSHAWTNAGVCPVSLTVMDVVGQADTKGTTVTFTPGANPVAVIDGPTQVDESVATNGQWYVRFFGTNSTDDVRIWKYAWKFGDGKTNSGPVVMTSYSTAGTYVVTLTVTDHAGQTNATTHGITTVPNSPPVAVIDGPVVVGETSATNGVWSTTFYATNSTDDYGIWKYEWKFGDGKTGTGATAKTTYNTVGTNIVTLTVTDNVGQTNFTTHIVVIKANDPPVPVIGGNRLLTEAVCTNGQWFGAFDGLASMDDTGICKYEWNFGDGTTGSGPNVTHLYGGVGVFRLALKVTDNGNQSISVTQNVIVVANDPPVARITAGTLTPEGAQPVSLSAANSTDDYGILSYRWLLPPQVFDFTGPILDTNQWRAANVTQNDKLIVTGKGGWGQAYFFAPAMTSQRGVVLEGQVDTPSGTSYAMIGLRDQNANPGNYGDLVYAVYFNNGDLNIYEYGNNRGKVGTYDRGTSYDFRIQSKPGAGAIYYLRPSGTAQPFAKLYESSNYSDATLGLGADVNTGVFGFDVLSVAPTYPLRDVTVPVWPGGTVTLEVVDHAFQTNTASVVITPITGTPPVAIINGPTSGQAGVELTFDGYFSSDDHGIASYTWDFGDGSSLAYGPVVTHHCGTPGTYTNTLKVLDYAGQQATASLVVQIAGGNQLVAVPWQIINGIRLPHEVYSGKTNTVKAVAQGVPIPFTYIWDFGDGSETVTNSVTTTAVVYNLEARHAYTGAEGTPFSAKIQVILTNGTVLADTYTLVMRPKTLDTEMKVAIDEGLWRLQKTQSRYDLDVKNKAGDWTDNGPYGGYKISPTASAVQAFAINGHLMTDDASKDPYVETVQRGVNYLLTVLSTINIGPQTYGDPDANRNGIGLSGDTGRPIYETGPMMDALIAAGRPELVAPVGPANVRGRTFKDIIQDMVDMYAWGQSDYTTSYGGGWQYSWNQGNDNSASQWAAIGFLAAERIWGIPVPAWVKERNLVWIAASKGGTGFGYTGAGDGEATTPSAMVQLALGGVATTNALWIHGEKYLANDWQNIMNRNNLYAQYSIAKALRTANPPVHNLSLTGLDWFRDPTKGLARTTIDRQRADGSWLSASWVGDPLSTSWSVIILSSSLFQRGPVAVINAKPNPSAMGYPVVLDGRNSYHRHPAYKIVEYRWDFDASNGVDFDYPDAIGPVATNAYGSLSTNTVSLQVRDNATPQLNDTATVVIRTTVPPYPPTADAGGPYVICVGQDLHLDGSGSFTVDAAAGNFIQSYDWETDFQQPLDFNDGTRGMRPVLTNGFATPGQHQVGLRIKNANSLVYTNFSLPDMTSDDFATVFVYDRVITDLRTRAKGSKIQLTWTKVGDYIVVARSQLGPDRGFQEIGRTDSAYATFLDTNVQFNVEYYYRVYAYQNGRPDPLGVSDSIFTVSRQRGSEDNPPVFQSTPELRFAVVGIPYVVVLDARDPENDPITFNLLSGPAGMSVNPSNGVVRFTPTAAQIGSQAVSFDATNQAGRDVISYNIFVFPASNNPPVANANGPYSGLIGVPIQFSAAGSSDPDGNPLAYTWNFGDGTLSTNADPAHTYSAIGDYIVTLYVNDGYGGTTNALASAHVTRPNRPPVASLAKGPHFTARWGESLMLDASASYDLDGDPLTYQWFWGDSSSTTSLDATASHLYPAIGSYSGILIVADNRGGAGTNHFDVLIAPSNRPPVVASGIVVSTNSPFVMTTVTFDATSITDPEGDPMSFEWDFGDHYKTTGPLVTHVFRQIADFTVSLTVSDNHGGVGIVTQLIHVLNAPPVFTSNPPLIVRADHPYTYTPSLTDLDNDARTFQLATGPATMACDPNTGTLTWLPGTNDLGPNAIVLRATDAGGASTDQAFTLVVTTPLGTQLDLEPTHIAMTNVFVDAQSLALAGTVRVILRNNGTDTNPVPFTVSLFVDVNGDGTYSNGVDRVVGYGNFPAGFPPGGLGWIEMVVSGQALFKDAPLFAFVDSENVVPEYDKSNNIQRSGFDADTNTPPVIDLSAAALLVDRTALPAKATLTARLGNSGLVSVPTKVPMAFYDGDPRAGGARIGVASSTKQLAPGRYEDLTVTWTAPTITNHTVYVVADDSGFGTNLFSEITLSNNTLAVPVDLAAVLAPIADAGPDQSVYAGDTVILNGRGSKDPQGKTLTYRWAMRSIPIGSRAQLTDTNTVNPSFQADVGGDYAVQLVVNNGILDSSNAIVTISAVDTNVNYPPSITSKPSFQGMLNVLYQYPVTATDPQGKPLAFRLMQAPAGMTVNTNTGLVQWTPTNTGSFFVQVAADGVGGSAWQSYSLAIISFTNLPPQFTSTPVQTAVTNTAYVYNVTATDPNRDTITFGLAQKPAGMSINATSGVLTWTPTAAQLGGNPVSVTATDSRGAVSTQAFNIVVLTAGADGPIVSPIPSQAVVGSVAFTAIPLDNYVVDPKYPDSQILWTITGTTKLVVTINSNRVATITYPAGTLTSESVTFLATDPAGKSGFATALLTVRTADNPPVATIANLSDTDTTSITSGFFELKGTANDPDTIDPVAYRIGLYDADGLRVFDVTPPPVNAAGWHEGRVPAGGSLGTLDFTLVLNGGYTLALEVRGGDQITSAQASIALDSQLKIGQVKFSQQDVVIPASHTMLAVIRTYDSLNPSTADFGYSWTYSVSDLGLTINEQRAQAQDVFGDTFSLRTGGGRDVTLDMPDTGRRVTFRYSLQPAGLFKLRATWTPPGGINATLVPTVSPIMIDIQLYSQKLTYWQAAPLETSLENFDFAGFILTLQDGTEYRIDREYLGSRFIASDSAIGSYVDAYGKSFLTRVSDPAGDRVEFVRSGAALQGIDHYTGTNKTRSLVFQRDAKDRITAVFGPDKLDAQGNVVGPADVTYEYDAAGNLLRANRLKGTSATNAPVYSSVTYVYGHPRFPHYITEIKDDRGVSPLRMEYDSVGRLVATIDANGNRTEVQHDSAGRTDTMFDRLGNPTVLSYDERGNVTSRTDPLGRTVRLTYDANGKETSVTDPLGNTTRMEYDASGNLTAKIDPLGNRASYAYDSAGHLRSTTDPLGNVTTNTFDAKGNIMRSENALGFASDYQYDTQGRLTMLMDALGNTNSQAQYDSADNIRQVTTGSGQAMTFGYDARGNQTTRQSQWVNPNDSNDVRTVATRTDYDTSGNPTKSVDAFGRETVTTLNEFGKVASTRDCYGHVTAYTYDVLGKLIEMLYPDGSATRAVYDENGRVVVAVDRQFPGQPANGTHTVYDAAGQVLVQERLSNVVVQVTSVTNNGSVLSSSHFVSSGGVIVSKRMSYDAAGRVVAVTNFFGQTTRYEYDAAGHNTARIDPSGYRTEYGYDAAGRQTVVRDALGREVHYLYDALNQRVQTIFPDGTSVRTTYDALGRRVSEVNQAGKAKSFEYDAAGRVAAVSLPHVTDPDAANALIQPRSEFTYDAYSNMEVSRDAKGRETQFSYDEMNRQLTRILPLGQVQSNAYNASGQLFRQTDFKGQVTELLYDNFGRITNRNLYAAGSNTPSQKVAIAYDTMGRLDTITDARGTMRYTYDGQTGVSQITTPEGTLHYEYDALGRRVRTHTDNTDTRYTYDNYGRLQTVTAVKRNGQVLSTPETTTYNYDVIGRRQSTTLPNGVTTRYQYDDLDRLTVLTHSNAASGALTTYTYTRNANGLKTGVAELKSGVGVSPITNLFGHTYDALNRLVTETNRFNTNGFNSRYTYDLVGNRLLREVTVGTRTLTTTYRYDANDRLLVESNYVSSLRPSGASIPVLIRDGDGSLQFMCRPQPSAWSYYLIKSVPYFLGLALLIPIALVSRRQWRRIHIVSTDLCPQRALLPRCLAGLLAGLMAWLPFDTRVLADEAALYTALSTDTWGLDGSVTSYEYDANGSVTKKTTKGPKPETVEYSHNLDNRLVSATTTFTNGANHVVRTSHYAYNENGIRVRSESSVTINGVGSGVSTNLYLIDPLNHTGFAQVLEELPAFGAVPTVSYTIGDDVISQATAVATDYFLYDGHGSTRQLMDPSGSVTDEYSYDASGMMIGGNPTTSQPARTSLLYTGEQFDTGLQQYNLRARNYDPSIGRFTSMDPFPGSPDDPQSLHKYAYAHDDPVNNVDPSGQMSLGEVMTCLAIFSIILSYGIAPLLSVLTSGKFLPDASLTGFNLFLPPYVGGGTVAAVVGVLAAMTLGGVPLPILGILQKAGLNVVGSLQRAVTYLNSGSGFGLSLSFEALSDVQDKSLSGWVAIGPAFGIGSSASFGGSIYTGVVWNTNQYEDYAGAFWGAGYGIGTGVSYAQSLFAGSGFTQWGVATGVAFGSSIPISGSVSWTYYYLIAAQRPASYDTLKWTIAVGLLSPTTTIWANWLVRKLYNNPPVALDPVKHVTPLTEDPIKAVFGYPPP